MSRISVVTLQLHWKHEATVVKEFSSLCVRPERKTLPAKLRPKIRQINVTVDDSLRLNKNNEHEQMGFSA